MSQSTEQLLQTKSTNLNKIRPNATSYSNRVDNLGFMEYDYNHMYNTTYNTMSTRVFYIVTKAPKILNKHIIPGYNGFVPGIKSEVPFAKTYGRIVNDRLNKYDKKRFNNITVEDYRE